MIDSVSTRGQGVLDLIHESLLLLDRDGRIRDLNRAAQLLYGWSADTRKDRLNADLLAFLRE